MSYIVEDSYRDDPVACAKRGAVLLDEHFGGDRSWRKLIPASVAVANPENCPLHWIFGDYTEGCTTLGLEGETVTEHGFCGVDGDFRDERMNAAWVAESKR